MKTPLPQWIFGILLAASLGFGDSLAVAKSITDTTATKALVATNWEETTDTTTVNKSTYGALHAKDQHWCFGVGARVGGADWGVHGRALNRDIWGFDIRSFFNWNQMGAGFTGLVMYKMPLDAPVRPYIAGGAGAYWAQVDTTIQIDYGTSSGATTPYEYESDFVIPHFMGLVGAEWRFGKNERHALALELGYQFGKTNYEYSYTSLGDTGITTEQVPYEVKPFEANLLYTFYFCKVKDRDEDGIKDTKDQCPDLSGVTEYNGCPNPDSDGDKVLNPWVSQLGQLENFKQYGTGKDSCPDVAGPLTNRGCPILDRDGDGVVDSVDLCPDLAGESKFYGCPNPDKDGDGICSPGVAKMGLSKKFASLCHGSDNCPNEPETKNEYKDTDGCPDEVVVAKEITREPIILHGVTFKSGKATLKPESYVALDEVVASLEMWAEVTIEIDGHTDDVGNADANMDLSLARAEAVKAYLVSKGIAESRLVAIGHGEEQPIADNWSPEGRQLNRRVTMERSN